QIGAGGLDGQGLLQTGCAGGNFDGSGLQRVDALLRRQSEVEADQLGPLFQKQLKHVVVIDEACIDLAKLAWRSRAEFCEVWSKGFQPRPVDRGLLNRR